MSRSAGCCCSRSCCSPCCPPHQSSPSGLNTFKFPIFILSLSSINKYHNQGDGADGWPLLLHLHDGQRDLRPVRHLQAAAPACAARHPHPAVHPPPQVCISASLYISTSHSICLQDGGGQAHLPDPDGAAGGVRVRTLGRGAGAAARVSQDGEVAAGHSPGHRDHRHDGRHAARPGEGVDTVSIYHIYHDIYCTYNI